MQEKKYKIHSVKYNFIMNVILKMSSFIFPLITFPYVSRVLGPVGNGKVSFATSVVYYFTVIATLGIPTYGVKICAQYRDDSKKLAKTVKELLIIETIMMVVSYLIFFIALRYIPRLAQNRYLMLINSVSIVLSVFGVEWFYQAIEQYDYITFRNLLFKVISVILMFLCVKKSEDYILYGAITVLGTSGSNILNIFKLSQYVNLNEKSKLQLYQHIRPIFTLFLFTASTMVYTSLDTLMLGFIKGDEAVGFYNAATKLKGVLVSIVTALGTVLLPRLSNCLAVNNIKQFNELIKKSFNFVFILSLPLAFYLIIEARECIQFLAGDGYEGAILPMQLIMITIFFIGLTNVIGIQILIPTGYEKYTVISTTIGALVNLVLNSFFIYFFSASGAALATSIAELSVLITQLYMIRDNIKSYLDKKNLMKILSSSIIAVILLIIFINFINLDNAFLELLITSIVFFGTYLCMLIILNENLVITTLKNVLAKLHK